MSDFPEAERGAAAALAAEGKPLQPGDIHTVGHIHPAAYATISREGWEHHERQIAEHLAKHEAVESPDAVEVHLYTHQVMADAMAEQGIEGHPTGQVFDAAALIAVYRAER